MKNKTSITKHTQNLLESDQFVNLLQFEAAYANSVKGGHLPEYLSVEKRKRIVNPVNILNSSESIELIQHLFIGKN